MSKASKPWLVGIISIMVLAVSAFGWWWQGKVRQGQYRDLIPAFYVMGVLKTNYYQPVSLTHLMKAYWRTGNIEGMLKSLNDPYTRFLDKEEYSELRKETSGAFGGIGVYLIPKETELLISSVVKGSPGAKAGLQQGDRIIEVGHVSVKKLTVDVAIAKIRGPVGTSVLLKIARGEGENKQELDFKITRQNIIIPTVEMKYKWDQVIGKYAHIKIFQFAETTPVDLEKALRELDQQPEVSGIILDLRANPGGSLDAAHRVASQFLPEGTPIIHIQRRGYPDQTLVAKGYNHRKLPVVVLADSWSASASEIVAGALKDQKRAFLIGTNTFGKDLIQEVKELPGGVGITVTIASYLTSGRKNIHKKGVAPDLVVEIPGAMDRLLKKGDNKDFYRMQELQEKAAVQYLRSKIAPALKNAG